jgi:methylenetetrahydrofolate dehydrogenase (NADP+) / methenyltetrahydrofolate cyclohydrolase
VYDGKILVARLSARIKRDVERVKRQHHIEAGLGILLVTGDQVSMSDSGKIASTAEELGFVVHIERVAQRNVARKFFPTLDEYATSPFVQGIYIQLPLPTEIISIEEVMKRLPPSKDITGMHFISRGRATYAPSEVSSLVYPPEILAVGAALKECKVELKGGKVVIIGSIFTLGMVKLLSNYLFEKGCNVRLVRYENSFGSQSAQGLSKLKAVQEPSEIKKDDIVNPEGEAVVTWANQPGWLTRSRLTAGSVIIDMGYRFARGWISGDCDFQSVVQNASIVSPVPGGVRNLVRIMILQNLVELIREQIGARQEDMTTGLRRRFGGGAEKQKPLRG